MKESRRGGSSRNGPGLVPYRRLGTLVFLCCSLLALDGRGQVSIDLEGYATNSEIRIELGDRTLNVRWLGSGERFCELVFSLLPGAPLVRSVSTMEGAQGPVETILRNVNPVTILSVGERDLRKRNGWMIFFDKVHTRPSKSELLELSLESVTVVSRAGSTSVEFSELSGVGFSGTLRFIFYSGSSLIRVEAEVETPDEGRAILYDAGITAADSLWQESLWLDSTDRLTRVSNRQNLAASSRAVRYRTIVAEGENGSLALFPPPHQFFYPLDFADNFGFVWHGPGYRNRILHMSMGIRQPLDGDRRYVPWFNAPPRTKQRLAVYWYLTDSKGEIVIDEVARYTRGDRYEPLEGHLRMTSHYHVEHSLDYLRRQDEQGTSGIPEGLESPGFVESFKRVGADIVHLAEFHNGRTPRLQQQERLRQLAVMHQECARLSNEEFLLLPGEEPNVHLGGHWISFFPKPVNWVLNRPEGTPFVQRLANGESLYHVGSRADILELMNREKGLMWAAHPRIKGSTGYPDQYRQERFFESDRFLGAAWKAMPADLSWDRLGRRVLDLLDDMSNWGHRKHVLGEVDVFKVQPDYELYGHMNMNYLRLDALPKYEEGWGSVLNALRQGQFFVTTGEILLRDFRINGAQSGEVAMLGAAAQKLRFELDWTFPLAFAELISGDGQKVYREKIDLSSTKEFGRSVFSRSLDLKGRRWVRLEVWDSAANGVFSQPIWLEEGRN